MKLIVFSLFFLANMMHPVHVSLTNIELDKSNNTFIITFKFFKDDFKHVIAAQTGFNIDVESDKSNQSENEAVANYLNNHFSINWLKGKMESKFFLKKEIDDLSVWYYLKIPLNNKKASLKINNSLLLDLYTDQKNLLIYSDVDNEISEIFDKNKTSMEINN